ncbi:MAG: periplasmic heavy metal sensor [candidate division NC10 bacterium]|nr:periplasmic heavy metal sensor [candidate division NC10 bacterium]MDE2485545.1 periplasmic heavy metal sensor [candidate division NC10 bacterium]
MHTRKQLTGVVILVGILAASLWTASAYGQPHRDRAMRWERGEEGLLLPLLVRGAGLTETQQAQLKQLVASHRSRVDTLQRQLRAARDQLVEKLYTPGPLKAEDLTALTQQIGKVRESLAHESLQVALEVRKLLTPEQLAKVKQRWQRLNELRAEIRSLLEEGR